MDSEKHSDFNDPEISDALTRIISSAEFEKAYRLRQLLEHLVNKQLAGEEHDLKGYNIGLDVFEKGKDFDPDSDTIVRVQMVRLRRMLEHYYLTHGKDEEIIIEIPKGRYVPSYRHGESLDSEQHFARVSSAFSTLFCRIKAWFFSEPYLFTAALGAMFLFAWLSSSLLPTIEEPLQKTVMKRFNYRVPTGPSIAVFPFNNETRKKEHSLLIRGLPAHIIHTLTRFKQLFILAPDTTLAANTTRAQQLEKARMLKVDYALIGGFGINGKNLSTSVFMIRVDTGQIIWSKDYNKYLSGDNFHEIQNNIASSVARELGQPFGIINRLETAIRRQKDKRSFSAYECVLLFFDSATGFSEVKHLEQRNCLERVTKTDPGYAQAWAALAWTYVDEFRHGYNARANGPPPLDRALAAAQRAVGLDPNDAFTHRYMSNVHIARGEYKDGLESIMRAVDLNPNNANVLADAGWSLKANGDWDDAFRYASKAIRLNPGHRPWYLETSILYYYQHQDCKNAHATAKSYHRHSSKTVIADIFVIVTGMLCKVPDVASYVTSLNATTTPFLMQPRKLLRNYGIPKETLQQIIAHLQEAGVAVDGIPSKI